MGVPVHGIFCVARPAPASEMDKRAANFHHDFCFMEILFLFIFVRNAFYKLFKETPWYDFL